MTLWRNKEAAFQVFKDSINEVCDQYDIPAQWRDRIISLGQPRQYAAKQVIFERGKHFDEIWFIVEGGLKSSRLVHGKEWVYTLTASGQYVYDFNSYLTEKPSALIFEAVLDSVVYSFKKKDLEQLYIEDPITNEFGRFVAEYAADIVLHRVIAMQSLSLKERYDLMIKTFPDVVKHMQQQDIAEYIGATPQSLSRILNS